MLDQVCIFTKAGIVLWSKTFVKMKGKNPVRELVNILLEEKAGDNTCVVKDHTLKWVRVNKNEVEFFIVAVYPSLLTLAYVDDLLEAMKKSFYRQFEDDLRDKKCIRMSYDKDFDIILRAAEAKSSEEKKMKKSSSQVCNILFRFCTFF